MHNISFALQTSDKLQSNFSNLQTAVKYIKQMFTNILNSEGNQAMRLS